MIFPKDNKVHGTTKSVDEKIQTNAELLQEHLRRVDWKYLLHVYAFLFSIFLGSLFFLIVTVRLALWFF